MEERPHKAPFWGFFIDNYRFTYLLVLAVVIFGLLSIVQIPKESAPEVNIPVVVITTPLPGAGAQNVEELVTRPIENQISGLPDMVDLTSTSQQGISTVVVQFDPGADVGEKLTEIRSRVDRSRPSLPSEAGEPTLQQVSFSDVPIMTLVMSGPYEPSDLSDYADDLKDRIEAIRNVSQVSIAGAPSQEISVRLRSTDLLRLNVTANEVISAISRGNVDVPIGSIETGGSIYSLRLDSSLVTAREILMMPVVERDGTVIRVSDVAIVEDGYSSLSNIARFSIGGSEPAATVSLRVFKESGQGDILQMTDQVEDEVSDLSEYLPGDVGVEMIQSDADIIRNDLQTLVTSGAMTMVIILLILALFLGWREALLASIVVPISFLMAFIILNEAGLTINFLTLFSLILSLGILVDASIVVTESIYHQRSKGRDGSYAAFETVKQFQAPLMAGTLTTVFVFAPMILVSGIIGEFIKSIPITVSAVLLSSLFVALGIVTTVATRFLRSSTQGSEMGMFGIGQSIKRLADWYEVRLSQILYNKRRSYLLLGSLVVGLLVSFSFLIVGLVTVNMFPSPDADIVYIDVEAAPGTPLRDTSSMIEPIEDHLREYDSVRSFYTVIGQGSQAGSMDIASASNTHVAGITINLIEGDRPDSQTVVSELDRSFSDLPGLSVRVTQMEEGPPAGESIQVNVTGTDLEDIEETARMFRYILSEIEGTRNVQDGIESTAGEFVITIDRSTASIYGMTSQGIADILRTSVFGRAATELRTDEDEIDVIVMRDLRESEMQEGVATQIDVTDITSMMVSTPRGNVALSNFVDVELQPGRSSINRRDRERIISVTSDMEPGYQSALIIDEFESELSGRTLPQGVSYDFGGEADDIAESFQDLFRVMIIGVLLIFALMVLQFKSFRQPMFIITTIPLALIGVLFGLALVQQPLSFPAFIGVVALSGIVVNNAIILIDTINKNYREEGWGKYDSVIRGAKSRLRPVLLTTATTSFGLVPLVFVSPTWAPVAYSIIFGLIFSTVLTLLAIPILYVRFAERM